MCLGDHIIYGVDYPSSWKDNWPTTGYPWNTYAAYFSGTLGTSLYGGGVQSSAYGIARGAGVYTQTGETELDEKKFRIGRQYDPRIYGNWIWKWQLSTGSLSGSTSEEQAGSECWLTFATITKKDIEDYVDNADYVLSRSYYPVFAFGSIGKAINKTSSVIDPKIVNHSSQVWSRSKYSLYPTASMTYCYPSGFITNDKDTYRTNIYKDYGLLWNVAIDRIRVRGNSRNPSYNSYEDYAQELRSIGKEYSILPEYRISEHIDTILKEGAEKTDFSFLSLPGAFAVTSSGRGVFKGLAGGGVSRPFYNLYSDSDFLSELGEIKNTHDPINISQNELTVSCEAILKLLPYEGFYPITRTTQIGSIFNQEIDVSSSLDGYNVELFTHNDNTSCWDEIEQTSSTTTNYNDMPGLNGIRKQAIITPLFGPGILYNSIKSGLSVAWTISTSSNLQETYKMWNVDSPPKNLNEPGDRVRWKGNAVLNGAFLNTCVYHNSSSAKKIPFEALWSLSSFPKADLANTTTNVGGAFHVNYPEANQGFFTESLPSRHATTLTPNRNFMVRARELEQKGEKISISDK